MSIVISDGGDSLCKTYNANCVGISYDGSKIICGGSVERDEMSLQNIFDTNFQPAKKLRVPAIFSYNNNTWSTKLSDISFINSYLNSTLMYTTYNTENMNKTTEIIDNPNDPRIFEVLNPANRYNILFAKIGDNAYMSNDGSVQALAHSGSFVYTTLTVVTDTTYYFPKTLFKNTVKLTKDINNNIIIDTIPNTDNKFLCTDLLGYSSKQFIIGDSSGKYLYLVKNATLYASDNGVDNFRSIASNSNIGFNLGFSVDREAIPAQRFLYNGGILAGAMSNIIDTNLYTIFIVKTLQGGNKFMTGLSTSTYNYNLYISTSFGGTFKLITKASSTENFPEGIEWIDVIMSKDGKYILALYKLNNDYGIYRSTNGTEGENATFTNLFTPLITTPIDHYCMTMSDDGKRMMYIIRNTINLYYSNNYGVTWSLTYTDVQSNSIKLSGDGNVLVIGQTGGNFYRKTITWPA